MPARIGQRGKFLERGEMRRITAQYIEVSCLRSRVPPHCRQLARLIQQSRDLGLGLIEALREEEATMARR